MKTVNLSVPGKILLAGEYAVLEAHPALSFAVDRMLRVEMEETSSGGWILQSNLWPLAKSLDTASLEEIRREPLLQVASFARKHFALPHVRCRIESELDIRFGLGSSTALRLGVWLGALSLATARKEWDQATRLEAARTVYHMQLEQQTFASGYDVLTQAMGGLLHWTPDFQNWPGPLIEKMPTEHLLPHLRVLVGGQGAPTAKVGSSVRQALAQSPRHQEFLQISDELISAWLRLLQLGASALPELCAKVATHRRILAEFPYFPKDLFARFSQVPGFDTEWTVKTTGAGGEDALLVIGTQEHTKAALDTLTAQGWYQLPLACHEAGACLSSRIHL